MLITASFERFHEMHCMIPAVILEGEILIDNFINEYNEDLPMPMSEDFLDGKEDGETLVKIHSFFYMNR